MQQKARALKACSMSKGNRLRTLYTTYRVGTIKYQEVKEGGSSFGVGLISICSADAFFRDDTIINYSEAIIFALIFAVSSPVNCRPGSFEAAGQIEKRARTHVDWRSLKGARVLGGEVRLPRRQQCSLFSFPVLFILSHPFRESGKSHSSCKRRLSTEELREIYVGWH